MTVESVWLRLQLQSILLHTLTKRRDLPFPFLLLLLVTRLGRESNAAKSASDVIILSAVVEGASSAVPSLTALNKNDNEYEE